MKRNAACVALLHSAYCNSSNCQCGDFHRVLCPLTDCIIHHASCMLLPNAIYQWCAYLTAVMILPSLLAGFLPSFPYSEISSLTAIREFPQITFDMQLEVIYVSFTTNISLLSSLTHSLPLSLSLFSHSLFSLSLTHSLSFSLSLTLTQMFARIDMLSTDDIKATANKLINDEDHVLTAIGTIGNLPDYDWIRKRSVHQ